MTKDNNLLGKFHLDGIPLAPRGEPQIEVTFEINENGILDVRAQDDAGNSNKITITNEKGRLTQAEIDRILQDAEKYRAQDESNMAKLEAKNKIENYCFTTQTMLRKKRKLDEEKPNEAGDRENALQAVQDTLDWLDRNQLAEKDEFEAKHKELEDIVKPIMMKLN